MNRKVRLIWALLIAWIPGYGLRRLLYGALLGYRIDRSARIGWRTILAVREFQAAKGVVVDRFNIFRGPMAVRMAEGARVGRLNRFTCPWHVVEGRFAQRDYRPGLNMGEGALFMDRHEVDLFGTVTLGRMTWFGGSGSQLWTHGLSVTDRDIVIGDGNYIGASVRFGPGAALGHDNIVALGSVILSKIEVDAHLIAGVPARPMRSIRAELDAGRYHRSFDDW